MDKLINQYLLPNWPRKCFAVLVAIIVWFFVNHSITGSKTVPNVPIRIINIPADKTIQGLLPNGILNKRIPLTLYGTKDVVEQIEPGDLEILIDAASHPDEWVVQITKKNLVSLNPNINLAKHISYIVHAEFTIKLSKLVTAKIPVTITKPIGAAPKGYEFLDIWPNHMLHTVTGPEEQVAALQKKGIELTFDLKEITKSDLDTLKNYKQNQQEDEVSFFVPAKWKQVSLPFRNNATEEINDPEAQQMHIDFLRKHVQTIKGNIPIRIFFPFQYLDIMNPTNYQLAINEFIFEQNGVFQLKLPLYALEVSQLFLDTVRPNMEIAIIAAPPAEQKVLDWSLNLVDQEMLENAYVTSIMHIQGIKKGQDVSLKEKENFYRQRFRHYINKFFLLRPQNKKLVLDSRVEGNKILVKEST